MTARRLDDAEAYRDEAKATIARCLAVAVQLDESKRTKYRAAAEAVVNAMGFAALKRWNRNVQSITFHSDSPRSASQTSPGCGVIERIQNFLLYDARLQKIQCVLIGELNHLRHASTYLVRRLSAPLTQFRV